MRISIVRERLRNRAQNEWGPGGGAPGSSGVLYILEQFDGLIFLYMYTSRSGTGWTLSFPFFLLLLPFFFYAKKWGGARAPPAPPPPRFRRPWTYIEWYVRRQSEHNKETIKVKYNMAFERGYARLPYLCLTTKYTKCYSLDNEKHRLAATNYLSCLSFVYHIKHRRRRRGGSRPDDSANPSRYVQH